jgi:hypothetical protein
MKRNPFTVGCSHQQPKGSARWYVKNQQGETVLVVRSRAEALEAAAEFYEEMKAQQHGVPDR